MLLIGLRKGKIINGLPVRAAIFNFKYRDALLGIIALFAKHASCPFVRPEGRTAANTTCRTSSIFTYAATQLVTLML